LEISGALLTQFNRELVEGEKWPWSFDLIRVLGWHGPKWQMPDGVERDSLDSGLLRKTGQLAVGSGQWTVGSGQRAG